MLVLVALYRDERFQGHAVLPKLLIAVYRWIVLLILVAG